MLSFWISVFEQGLIFGIMALGVYITYKILDFPDLSVDGTFALGASLAAAAISKGIDPFISCILSTLGGAIAGAVTGFLHVKLKITNLLSGILVMIGLYSINLRIMGKSNLPLFNERTIFYSNISKLLIIFMFVIIAKVTLDIFFKTKLGFAVKATGDNPSVVTSLGINIGTMKIIALMISNGLVGLSGSIMAQHQGFSDVGMGNGIIVMGLASIILGESFLKNFSIIKYTTIVIIGSILYKMSIGFALNLGFPTTDFKLITAIVVICALSLNKDIIKINLLKTIGNRGDNSDKDTKSIQSI